MNYIDLLETSEEVSTCIENDRVFLMQKHLNTTNWAFTSFRHLNTTKEERKALDTNWKARISVHPDDLEKAWRICSPYLFKRCKAFKVVDMKRLSKLMKVQADKDEKLSEIKDHLLNEVENIDISQLKSNSYWLFNEITPEPHSGLFAYIAYYFALCVHYLALFIIPQSYVYSYVETQYELLFEKQELISTSMQRFNDGMQFTIYMCPGAETAHWNTLNEIEQQLNIEGVRPGKIYKTDRALGQYISVRHPGTEKYHNAITVSDYNPDGMHDPFEPISLQHAPNTTTNTKRFFEQEERKNTIPLEQTNVFCDGKSRSLSFDSYLNQDESAYSKELRTNILAR